MTRREFLPLATTVLGICPAVLTRAFATPGNAKRVFLAGFSHETNTFHPVPTRSFSYSNSGGFRLPEWKEAAFEIVPGIWARPEGGGTISEPACREGVCGGRARGREPDIRP